MRPSAEHISVQEGQRRAPSTPALQEQGILTQTRERLQDITVTPDCTSEPLLNRLIACYLGGLKPVTDNPELDTIHRKVILDHPVLKNNMFRRLLEGRMNPEDYEMFFSEYNNASQRNFYTGALPAALQAHDHPSWQHYIQHIIEEESEPQQHHLMFEKFMNACGATRGEPDAAAQEYAHNMRAGYTAELPFAAGYALGVEVEAGYEIAVLSKGLGHHFPQQLKDTEWFNVHLAEDQEVEHARVSVELVEDVLRSGGNIDVVRAGFVKFCDDVHSFMESVNGRLSASA